MFVLTVLRIIRKIYKYLLFIINMENNNFEQPDDTLYTKIDPDIKNRARIYITEGKLLKAEVDSMKDLVEKAIDHYIINNPHSRS